MVNYFKNGFSSVAIKKPVQISNSSQIQLILNGVRLFWLHLLQKATWDSEYQINHLFGPIYGKFQTESISKDACEKLAGQNFWWKQYCYFQTFNGCNGPSSLWRYTQRLHTIRQCAILAKRCWAFIVVFWRGYSVFCLCSFIDRLSIRNNLVWGDWNVSGKPMCIFNQQKVN